MLSNFELSASFNKGLVKVWFDNWSEKVSDNSGCCFLLCSLSLCMEMKAESQDWQRYGRSPVCWHKCLTKEFLWRNSIGQTGHSNCFSALWTWKSWQEIAAITLHDDIFWASQRGRRPNWSLRVFVWSICNYPHVNLDIRDLSLTNSAFVVFDSSVDFAVVFEHFGQRIKSQWAIWAFVVLSVRSVALPVPNHAFRLTRPKRTSSYVTVEPLVVGRLDTKLCHLQPRIWICKIILWVCQA